MVISQNQEVIERSFFQALLTTTLNMGLTLDPELYAADTTDARYKVDARKIIDDKGFFIQIYGAGNNQDKGLKVVPRIVIVPQGFIPGDLGLQHIDVEEDNLSGGYKLSSFPSELIDQFIEVHLVANTQTHIRTLHQIMFESLPKRGYLVPYNADPFPPFSGNIFIEARNFSDMSGLYEGTIEKVYYYEVKDTIIETIKTVDLIEPIKEINVEIIDGKTDETLANLNIKN